MCAVPEAVCCCGLRARGLGDTAAGFLSLSNRSGNLPWLHGRHRSVPPSAHQRITPLTAHLPQGAVGRAQRPAGARPLSPSLIFVARFLACSTTHGSEPFKNAVLSQHLAAGQRPPAAGGGQQTRGGEPLRASFARWGHHTTLIVHGGPRQVARQRVAPVFASSAASIPAPQGGDGGFATKLASFPSAFWKFLRPHTIRGTILGTTAVTSK